MTNDPINLFDKQICVDCDLPCHIGSGRFVNRYPVYNDDVEGEVRRLCSRSRRTIGGTSK